MKSLAALLVFFLLSGLVVACSSGSAGNPVQVSATQGGSLTLAGATLSVPQGTASGNGLLHASMAGAPPRTAQQAGTGESELLSAVSAPVHFTITGARLTRPVRITFRIRPGVVPKSLPTADRASAVWLSFYDPAAHRWQAVPTQYNPAAGTATAQVRHLSWWVPWTWDWTGAVLRLRQALSALGSGRAPAVSCPGVPHVTLTSVGGQDPPLIGCAAKAGPDKLMVSLTNNRGLTMVMSGVPADATSGLASYTGAAAFLTDHAFRDAFARRLGGALLPAEETIPYSVPLHGPPESFTASITLRSYLLDLALLSGEEGFGGLTHQYLNCVLTTVLRSQVPSIADMAGLATECLPVLAATSPTLKAIAKALGKKFLAIVTGVILDLKLVLQTSDIAYDQFRLIQGQVKIDRPAVTVGRGPSCPEAGVGVPAGLASAVAQQIAKTVVCSYEIGHLRVDPKDPSWVMFLLSPTPGSIVQAGYGIAHEVNGAWPVVITGSAQVQCDPRVPRQVAAAFGLTCP